MLGLAGLIPAKNVIADNNLVSEDDNKRDDDRTYWVNLLDKISSPVLSNMSKGELHKNMLMELSPIWDGRNKEVGYLEAFGRLLSGIAPFLEMTDDNSAESKIRRRLRLQAQQSIHHAVNPDSPDYLYWGPQTAQPLVDAAYFAQALLSAPNSLWTPLSAETKENVVKAFKTVRKIKPFNSNWLLFAAMTESFLLSIGEDVDTERIDHAIDQITKWYVGDGWYSDGPRFHFDHYNGYVMHPMLTETLKQNIKKGRRSPDEYKLAYRRMQRYATFLERYISPEGTYLVVGRSSTYRTGAFWPLVKLAYEDALPEGITPEQVRCALTAVMKRLFIPSTFRKGDWLTLGLVGDKQENIADYYSNTGSMYIASLVFWPLGLPASHRFWSGPFTEWTERKAWSGKPFPKDYAVDY